MRLRITVNRLQATETVFLLDVVDGKLLPIGDSPLQAREKVTDLEPVEFPSRGAAELDVEIME
jgi:hypothetical protein